MAKRYYWLKLNENFFEREEIKVIKDMTKGKDYIIFYLQLLLKSIKTEGELRFRDIIPYTPDMLASITNTDVDTVKVATDMFVKLGLMEKWDDGTLFMSETQNMIGSESASAKRVREHRKRKELENKSLQCNADETKSNTDIDKELDIDIDKELGKNNNNKKNDDCCDGFNNDLLSEEELSATKEDDFKVIANLYQKCGFTINGFTPEWIEKTLEQYGFEWFKNAILVAEKHDARSKSYIETILTNWNTNGGMDLGGKKKPQKPKGKKVQTQFHNFEQRTTKYSADELEKKVRKNFEKKLQGGG